MIAVVQRMASLRRFAARPATFAFTCAGLALAVALAVASSVGGCSARALAEVDVSSADTPFQSVTLRLSGGGSSKNFTSATFSATMPYRAGLYVDASGSVNRGRERARQLRHVHRRRHGGGQPASSPARPRA